MLCIAAHRSQDVQLATGEPPPGPASLHDNTTSHTAISGPPHGSNFGAKDVIVFSQHGCCDESAKKRTPLAHISSSSTFLASAPIDMNTPLGNENMHATRPSKTAKADKGIGHTCQ